MRGTIGARLLLAAALALLAAGVAARIASGLDLDDGSGTVASRAAAGGHGACGARTAATIAAVQTGVARRIYAEELGGAETRLDAARVAGYRPLLTALARGEQAAVRAAVHALVYTPHWHIVRLRVTRGASVLADVGGPHVLAPVRGELRVFGRAPARFVMSVQDDLGYVKLITRFIGAQVDLYEGPPTHAFVMGTLRPAPGVPADGRLTQAGSGGYFAATVPVRAFPAGPLQAALFVSPARSSQSCEAVRTAAFEGVARHVAARLHPLSAHLDDLADIVRTVTGGRLLLRTGARRLAGSGPARPPRSGSVRYAGRLWAVSSWQPLPGVRAFLLSPP
jgi:hypothetical protein